MTPRAAEQNGEKMLELGTFDTIEEAAGVAMRSRIGGAA